ncbi:MAG: trypsin-like serine protease [Hyphomicrobiales bacterium]|nr:trypsin-like serine protease [Hyphomicrobiales bacterium]
MPFASFSREPIRISIPAEFTNETELLRYLGLSQAELKKIWWFRGRMYRQFDIAKATGKKRLISAPDRRLKMLQRKIAASLDEIYEPRHAVHGFVRDRSVKSNAKSHLRSKFVLNLDVEGFFPSISESRVSGLFNALGISKRVSNILARICCNERSLPQGAPSSPVISNMICFRMDKELHAYAKEARCIYTRYADDITFSSYQPLNALFEGSLPAVGNFPPDLLKVRLQAIFQSNGFEINPKKAYYADKHSRQTVTGLRVNEIVNVDRRFVRNIRAALYTVEKKGVAVAQKELANKYKSNASLFAHLQGRVAWVGHVKGRADPIFRSIASRFNKLFPEYELKVLPTAVEVRDRAIWVVEHDEGEGSQGTAFFLRSVGLITAWHCVEGATEVELYHPSKPSNKFKATVLKHHAHRDLAILKHEILETEYYELEISRRNFKTGDSLTAFGYPGFGHGDKINVRPGSISSLPTKSGVPMLEVTQKLVPGMSGGPVLDDADAVAGVIHKGGRTDNRDFAIHINALSAWLREV